MSDDLGPFVAVMNWSRWVGECPRPRCGYAYEMTPGQAEQVCRTGDGKGCGYTARVEWPKDAAAIGAALMARPIEQDRNWAPAGHRQTHVSRTPSGDLIASKFPNGQSLADIKRENEEIEAAPPAEDPEDIAVRANAVLAEMGFQLDPDRPGELRRI